MQMEVYIPTGSPGNGNKFPYARRLPDLNGKTIAEVSNRLWESDRIFPLIRELLKARYPDIKFIPYTDLPNTADNISDNEELADIMLTKGADAVIGASAA